jgi:hypothetical protein
MASVVPHCRIIFKIRSYYRESGSVTSLIERHPGLARQPPWSDQCAAATRQKYDRR